MGAALPCWSGSSEVSRRGVDASCGTAPPAWSSRWRRAAFRSSPREGEKEMRSGRTEARGLDPPGPPRGSLLGEGLAQLRFLLLGQVGRHQAGAAALELVDDLVGH